MVATALLLSLALVLAIAFYLVSAFLFSEYVWALAALFGGLFLNIFADPLRLRHREF